jgi:TolB-like protein
VPDNVEIPPPVVLAERYRIERELGRGGMATVYLCTDSRDNTRVAVKILRKELGSAVVVERFLREITFASELDHPRIPKVLDSGMMGDLPYYVMTYIEGESLRARLDREKQLPIPAAIKITCDVIEPTSYAHQRGIIHRDIKPENIVLAADGVYVLDFGIARAIVESGIDRLTSTGIGVGTPAYMSPEQALGDRNLDARSDVYSIGCVLYEMIAGIAPFVGPTAQVIISRRFAASAPPLGEVRDGVPESLERIVACALARTPADRFSSAAELAEALHAPAEAVRRRKPSRQRRVTMLALVGLLPLALILASWRIWARMEAGATNQHAVSALDPRRVAVLYFRDLSPRHELGYLADGLTEGLIEQLQGVTALDVVSKNGVQEIRRADLETDSAARVLKAGTLVEGSVQPVSDRLRVKVVLTDGSTGTELKQASFEYPAGDPLRLRETLVGDVADLLRQRLGEEIRIAELKAGTRDAEAWVAAQKAERAIKQADGFVISGDTTSAGQRLHLAESLLSLSATRDPKWIDQIVMRGTVAYKLARLESLPAQMTPWIDAGMKSAEQALGLEPRKAAALELRGTLRYWKWLNDLLPDEKEAAEAIRIAEQDLRTAVRIQPSRASAWYVLSSLSNNKSVPDPLEATLDARRAYEEDAFLSEAPKILWQLYATYYDQEAVTDASHWCGEGYRRFPSDPRFVRCRLWLLTLPGNKPDIGEAWRLVGAMRALTAPSEWTFRGKEAQMLVAAGLARAGMADSARRVLLRSRADPSLDPNRDLLETEAMVRTILGDRGEAVRLLKMYLVANPQHRKGMAETTVWWWRDLKTDPGYQNLIRSGG